MIDILLTLLIIIGILIGVIICGVLLFVIGLAIAYIAEAVKKIKETK